MPADVLGRLPSGRITAAFTTVGGVAVVVFSQPAVEFFVGTESSTWMMPVGQLSALGGAYEDRQV